MEENGAQRLERFLFKWIRLPVLIGFGDGFLEILAANSEWLMGRRAAQP